MNFGALIHVTWKTPSISWFTSTSVIIRGISYVSEIINWFCLIFISLPCPWNSATSINCRLRGEQQGEGWRECHLVEMQMLLWSEVTFKGNLDTCDLYSSWDCISIVKSWSMDTYILTGFSYKWVRGHITIIHKCSLFLLFSFFQIHGI